MATTRHRSRPSTGLRYRPAPPPSGQDVPGSGKPPVLYARLSTIRAIPYDPQPPMVLREVYSFDLYFDWCYGIPLVDDPRDFIPDVACSSRAQIVEWQAAVVAAERGLTPMGPRDYPPFFNPWGIGISLIRKEVAPCQGPASSPESASTPG